VSAEDIRELAHRAESIDVTTPTKTAIVTDNPVVLTGSHLFKALNIVIENRDVNAGFSMIQPSPPVCVAIAYLILSRRVCAGPRS
jgi:hypothetical protein